MQEEFQDRWIDEHAKRLYRTGEDAPLDAIWLSIESRLDVPPRAARWWFASPALWSGVLAAAACLVIGFGLGRMGREPDVLSVAVTTAAAADPAAPYDQTTTALLGETVVLLRALPASDAGAGATARFSAQASELLLTTRLLLDSPAARDTRVHDLLQDLELVLAQVARLNTVRSRTDLELITEAVAERDIVPRIRRVAASLATSDN